MLDNFYVYRPEKTTGRLEGTYHKGSQRHWRPSLSYKHNIDDIRNQFTPAENFRYELATSGKYIRMIQRLEIRWNRKFAEYTWAATKVQALHRGNTSRAYYETIKQDLLIELKKRRAKFIASDLFLQNDFLGSIDEINRNLPADTTELLCIKLKCLYQLERYKECASVSDEIIVLDALNEEAYFLQACSWIKLNEPSKAYSIIKQSTIQLELPSRDTLNICAYIATKVCPPRYMEAVDSLTVILKQNSHDYNVLVERACCYFCLQEWVAGIKDLSFVLVFVPVHEKALLLRARAYACIREWTLARADYTSVLLHHPENEAALRGLKDVEDTVIVLPMLDNNLLDNHS